MVCNDLILIINLTNNLFYNTNTTPLLTLKTNKIILEIFIRELWIFSRVNFEIPYHNKKLKKSQSKKQIINPTCNNHLLWDPKAKITRHSIICKIIKEKIIIINKFSIFNQRFFISQVQTLTCKLACFNSFLHSLLFLCGLVILGRMLFHQIYMTCFVGWWAWLNIEGERWAWRWGTLQ